MPETAMVLLGWMERDPAIQYLREECAYDPPLAEQAAAATWEQYRAAVETLPAREANKPTRLPLNGTERRIADEFLQHWSGSRDKIIDVIKVDPLQLVARQLWVNEGQSNTYCFASRSAMVRRCLWTRGTPPAGMQVKYGRNVVDFYLPHGEWALHY